MTLTQIIVLFVVFLAAPAIIVAMFYVVLRRVIRRLGAAQRIREFD
jgi:hypothetical protein